MKKNKSMATLAREYIAHRQRLGYQMRVVGRRVLQFVEFAKKSKHKGHITTDLAVRWACQNQTSFPLHCARRLQFVRCFARYAAIFDAATEIPPVGLLGKSYYRIQPHIYSDDELRALMEEARKLPPADCIRSRTYVALFGLLVCTGIRITEAVRLKKSDVDLDRGLLKIVESKNRKSRLVVLHPTACIQLRAYERLRDQYPSPPHDPEAFFLSERGKALNVSMADCTFWGISHRLGWNAAGGHCNPRIYDIRHTFACRRLLQWYRDGVDIDHSIASLSTYMGHETLRDTYWYLNGIPELMQIAASRFELFAKHSQEVFS